MNEDVKRQWVSALRSGEYKQGQGGLKEDGRYCCLGVLCDLALKAGVAEEWRDIPVWGSPVSAIWDGVESNPSLPTRKILEWAGLEEENPFTELNSTLSYLNDSGWNFEAIANIIEDQL